MCRKLHSEYPEYPNDEIRDGGGPECPRPE
jgi:hypothetical protein